MNHNSGVTNIIVGDALSESLRNVLRRVLVFIATELRMGSGWLLFPLSSNWFGFSDSSTQSSNECMGMDIASCLGSWVT